jgi:hypothetical protein
MHSEELITFKLFNKVVYQKERNLYIYHSRQISAKTMEVYSHRQVFN